MVIHIAPLVRARHPSSELMFYNKITAMIKCDFEGLGHMTVHREISIA